MSTITTNIKQLGVQRYYNERWLVRTTAVNTCPDKGIALELYSGSGGMTTLYKQYFEFVITNDKDKNATAMFNMPALDFILTSLPGMKIGLVDFDAYGNPMFEIQEFFKKVKGTMAPIVVCITDGLGLHMKRTRSTDMLKKRFLLNKKNLEKIDLRYSWLYHPIMTKYFMENLAKKYKMKVRPIYLAVGEGKNFVFSSWLLETK